MVMATAAGGGRWAATVAEGGGKASKNVVQAKMEPIFEGSFAVFLAFFEVPAEGGTTFWQFQMTIPKIHEDSLRNAQPSPLLVIINTAFIGVGHCNCLLLR